MGVFIRIFLLLLGFTTFGHVQSHSALTNPTVEFVADYGGIIMDSTFNQGIYDAGKAATEDVGGTFTAVESPTYDSQLANLNAAASAGIEILIAAGATIADSLEASALANPNTLYGLIDTELDDPPANVVSAVFREDQAGYLAGTLAGSVTASRSVACIGGMKLAPVLAYCNGFRAGFLGTCQTTDCAAQVTYVSNFSDTVTSVAAANAFIESGVDVIFAPAGAAGAAAVLATAQRGTYCIGVDQDEYYTDFAGQPTDVTKYLLSSAIKRTDVATELLLQQFFDGSFVDGSIKVFDVNSGGVDLAPCHDSCDAWTSSTQSAVQSATLGLQQNIISTGVDSTTGQLLWTGASNDAVWAKITPWGAPPAARRLHSFAVLNNSYLVVFGGYDSLQSTLNDVHVADLSLDGDIVWVELQFSGSVPSKRAEQSTAVWTDADGVDRMVIFGGTSGDTSVVYNDVWVLELDVGGTSGVWTQLQTTGTAPAARRAQGMGVVNQTMYVFGGIDSTVTSVGDFFSLDLASLEWSQITESGPSARDSMSAVGMLGNRPGFYVFGGIQAKGRERVGDLWYYSSSIGWSMLYQSTSNSSKTSPAGLSSAVMGASPLDGLFLFGGVGQETGLISASLWHYNLYTSEWSLLYNPDVESPDGLAGAAAGIYADPLAPEAASSSSSSSASSTLRRRYRLAVFGGASRQSGVVNRLWLYGIEPVEQIHVSYFVCGDRQHYVDDTGLVVTDISAGIYLADYYCDNYIDCENMYDEGSDCSPSAEGIFIGFGVVAGLEIVIMAILFVLIVYHRNKVVFRIASIPFLLLVLFAGMWWTSAVFTFFGRPNDTACAFRPWWLAVSFTTLYGCLFAKEWRMAVLHESATKFRRLSISNLELGGVVLLLLVPDLIILVVWMAVDHPTAVLELRDGRYHYLCSSEYAELFFWLLVGYQLVLLGLGSVQAWRTRSLPTNFGESQYLALAIYDLLFLSAFVLPLLYLLQDQPNSLLIIIFIGITVSAGITVCLIYMPKFYILYIRKMKATGLNDFMAESKTPGTSSPLAASSTLD